MKLHRFLKRFLLYRRLVQFLQQLYLPGFRKASVWDVARFFVRDLTSEDINLRASSLAFSFFLALFPAILFFFTLIAYIPMRHLHQDILLFISDLVPKNTYESIKGTLEDILKKQRGGLLSFGFLVALFFSTNGVNAIMIAFNKYIKTDETRSFLHQRAIAILLTLILSTLVLTGVLLVAAGRFFLFWLFKHGLLPSKSSAYVGAQAVQWIFIILLFSAVFFSLYYFGPSKRLGWRFILPGTLLATVLSVLTTLIFSYYVNYFNSYNKLYGSIGALLVVLLLIYLNSLVLLIGFEINSSIDKAYRTKES